MEIRIVECNRCFHKWATRIEPKLCSGCKSPYWNKPRVRKRRKKASDYHG